MLLVKDDFLFHLLSSNLSLQNPSHRINGSLDTVVFTSYGSMRCGVHQRGERFLYQHHSAVDEITNNLNNNRFRRRDIKGIYMRGNGMVAHSDAE